MHVSKRRDRIVRNVLSVFALLLITGTMWAQNIKVTGTVKDNKGEPQIGVAVVIEGTRTGVSTDVNGAYEISAPARGTLVFSAIGMKTQEIPVNNRSTIDAILQEDALLLEELVVVGFGTQKKENVTGAVTTVDIDKSLSGKPINDVAKGLQGVVPGLTITYSNGDISKSPVMNIRGMGSLNAINGTVVGGSPLIVVDNVVVGDITLVNPEDIESISVLKDAASTSIYGARAAFGVVLIKTKSGSKDSKFRISYSNNFAWSTPTVLPQFPSDPIAEINAMDAAMTRSNQSFDMFGMKAGPLIAGITNWQQKYANNRNGKNVVMGEDFDIVNGVAYFYRIWNPIDEMYQKWIPQQNHNIQMNGGSEKLNFFLSGAYNYQEGIMKIKPDILNKYNITLGVNSKVNDWLDIDAKIMTRQYDYDYPYGYQDYYYYMWRWGAYFPYGTYTDPNGITAKFRNVNGFLDAASYCTRRQTYTNNSIGATIHLAKTLTLRSEFAYGVTNTSTHETGGYVSLWDFWGGGLPLNTMLPGAAYDETDYTASKSTQITSNTYFTYEEKFKDHGIKFIGGLNMEQGNYLMQFSKRLGLMDVNKGELPLATGTPSVNGDHSNWAVAGLFARVNYDYKGKYLAELNGRYDGSSNFPSTSRWAFFPSFSLGYRITEENWMSFIKPIVSDVKIRGSYGSIGNQNVGSDRFIAAMSTSTANWVIGSARVPYIGSPANVSQSLKWETINTLDLGLDVRFLKNKAGFSFDWFQRDNTNMLAAGATLPATFGSAAAFENAGSLRTSGWEIAADINHSFSNGINLYANVSVSDYASRIMQWNSNDAKLLTQNYAGKDIGEIWGFKTDRYFTDAADVTASPSQVGLQSGNFIYGPGDIKFKNLNEDNIISAGLSTLDDHGDLAVIGNTTPRYQYSFRFGSSWKNFDLDVFFQGVGKRDWWATGNEAIPYYRGADVMYDHQMDFWTPENTNARYPRPYPGNASSAISNIAIMAGGAAGTSGNNFYPQDKYLLNLAYLRLKSLTFGYTIPNKLTKKVNVDKVRIYFSAQNLFEIAQNKIPIDAEITAGSATSAFYGRTAPFTRTLSFGLQISL